MNQETKSPQNTFRPQVISKDAPLSKQKIATLLHENKVAKIIEIILVFAVALSFIRLFLPWAGESLVFRQGVIWLANILMLFTVWLGIRLRGDGLDSFGLQIGKISWKSSLNTFLLSLVVFAAGIAGYMLATIIMANFSGIPESSDVSGYAYMEGNVGMLIISLIGVFIVSSFGEEVVYRAFLINRLSELGMKGRFGIVLVVIISSIVFGLAHYSWGVVGIFQTTGMGLAMAISYVLLKKRIWILVLAHWYMDAMLFIQMYLGMG